MILTEYGMTFAYCTYAERDNEAGVWVTRASSIPGLVASHEGVEGLLNSIKALAPVLLQRNVYRRPNRPQGLEYEGPPEVEHQVVLIDPEGYVQRTTPTKINVLKLINGA
jgi:hypothetical protein